MVQDSDLLQTIKFRLTYLEIVTFRLVGNLSAVLDLDFGLETIGNFLADDFELVLKGDLVGIALGIGDFGGIGEFLHDITKLIILTHLDCWILTAPAFLLTILTT